MQLTDLVSKLEQLFPMDSPSMIARKALMMSVSVKDDLSRLDDNGDFESCCAEVEFAMNVSEDQQAAVAEELDTLASSNPCEFSPKHVWTLIRAIKVQKQSLDLYQCEPEAQYV